MDNQAFFNKLGDVKSIVGSVMEVSAGMNTVRDGVDEKAFLNLSGVWALMAYTMNAVYDKLDDMDNEFRDTYGVKWFGEMTDEERTAYRRESGAWV